MRFGLLLQPDGLGRVLVVSDLHMMVMNGGRERTVAQYRAIFDAANLNLRQIAPTGTAMSVIEGTPS